jgi:hypothetical protein
MEAAEGVVQIGETGEQRKQIEAAEGAAQIRAAQGAAQMKADEGAVRVGKAREQHRWRQQRGNTKQEQ